MNYAAGTAVSLFSIIIPTRQEADIIGRTLTHLCAARAATDIRFEIVVVDGGSTDETLAESAGLADHIVVDEALVPGRIAHARNVGGFGSDAPYLFHTDADVLPPDLGALLSRAVREFADPQVVALTAAVLPYPWTARRRDIVIHRAANAYFRLCSHAGIYFARGECQIVRRSAFEAVDGYNTNLVSGEDCDLFQRMHRQGRIVYLRDVFVYHSPRRFQQVGYLRMLWVYVREWCWTVLFGKSYIDEWPVVR